MDHPSPPTSLVLSIICESVPRPAVHPIHAVATPSLLLVDLPVLVGVGVSTPAQAAEVAAVADGVIVGTALVRRLLDGGGPEVAGAFVAELRAGLDTAAALFYAEGIHAVGIDRIIGQAGVAKATFYHHFPSKDELVRTYVAEQDRLGRAAVQELPDQAPRETVLAIFDGIRSLASEPGYRGCPYINAAAEHPAAAGSVRKAIDEHRRWSRDTIRELLIADSQPDPDRTTDILIALYDGLLVSSHLDDLTDLADLTRDAVNRILDAPR